MKINTNSNVKMELILGKQGESGVRQIEFDVTAWEKYYGSGGLAGVLLRDGDANPYPVSIVNNIWIISASDTAKEGYGKLQLSWVVGDIVKKSVIYKTYVMPSLNAETIDPPDPYVTYLDEIVAAGAQISADRKAIEDIAPSVLESAEQAHEDAINAATSRTNAQIAASRAEQARDSANGYMTTAGNHANRAKNNADNAQSFASTASSHALRAQSYKNSAQEYAESASESAQSASQNAQAVADILENISYSDTGNGNIVISMGGRDG